MDRRRKRADGSRASGGKKTTKGPEVAAVGQQEAAAVEEEVEEFCAILRRIHAAVKYFEKGKKGEGSRRLTISELEAIPEDDGAPWSKRRKNDDPGLDLNSEPSSETDLASSGLQSTDKANTINPEAAVWIGADS